MNSPAYSSAQFGPGTWGRLVWCAVLSLAFSTARFSHAQPAPSPPRDAGVEAVSSGDAATDAPADAKEAAATKAKQIRELIAGKLDPAIDPSELFRVDTSSDHLYEVLERAFSDRRTRTAADELVAAQAEFLRLRPRVRAARLAAHQRRRAAYLEALSKAAADAMTLERIEDDIASLRALIDGTLYDRASPESLLELNLLDPFGPGLDDNMRDAYLGRSIEVEGDSPLLAKQQELARLRVKFRALPADEQKRLLAAAKGPPPTPEPAGPTEEELAAARLEQERAAAEAAARVAETESARALAEAKGALLATEAAQLAFSATLEQRRAEIVQAAEASLAFTRQSRNLGRGDSRGAAELYDRSVAELRRRRADLDTTLGLIASVEEVARPAKGFAAPDSPELDSMAARLASRADELEREALATRWETARAQRDALVVLNGVRIDLITMLPAPMRDQLRGFSASGRAQAGRELDQIRLLAWFHWLALPGELQSRWTDMTFTELGLALIKVVLLLLALRLYRAKADEVTAALAERLEEGRSVMVRVLGALLRFVRPLLAPLGWLVFFWAFFELSPLLLELPEGQIALTLLTWLFIGVLMVRLVDSIVVPGQRFRARRSLRLRSLRLVILTPVALGLVMSLAEDSVGRGTIWFWLRNLSLAVMLAVLVVVFAWWRKPVIKRAKSRVMPSRFVAWVGAHGGGVLGVPIALLGAIYFLVEGFYRFLLAQATKVTPTKRLLTQLFRREVERRSIASATDGHFKPLEAETMASLAVEARPSKIVDDVMTDDVREVSELIRADNNQIIAIVGERGLGKTTFVERATSGLAETETLRVSSARGDFPAFLRSVAAAMSLPESSSEEKLLASLRENRPVVICVDDAQRLIRPAIGGLACIDEVVEFARKLGSPTSWVITIDSAAWQYLRRARGDRAVFDRVVKLRPWTEKQLGELMQVRASDAGIKPVFDALVLPRQFSESVEEIKPSKRAEHFYRILWDASGGNPAIASDLWRRSMFRSVTDAGVHIRLVATPPVSKIEALPDNIKFVLRSVVQLELASEEDVAACTALNRAEVADALRSMASHGFTEQVGDRIRITWRWYGVVLRHLRHQNLLLAD